MKRLTAPKWSALVLLTWCALGASIVVSKARAADCPVCDIAIKPAAQATMRVGTQAIAYRCVLCALVEAKNEYAQDDLSISAPSEKSGRQIVLKRSRGKWSTSPPSTVFLKAGKHRSCDLGYRAFTNKAALNAWAKQHGFDAKPLTLAQIIAIAK